MTSHNHHATPKSKSDDIRNALNTKKSENTHLAHRRQNIAHNQGPMLGRLLAHLYPLTTIGAEMVIALQIIAPKKAHDFHKKKMDRSSMDEQR